MVVGDFVTSRGMVCPVIERRAQLRAQMRSHSGVLAALGNHDIDCDGAYIVEVLQPHNIPGAAPSHSMGKGFGSQEWMIFSLESPGSIWR